jgi:hypothetical protein
VFAISLATGHYAPVSDGPVEHGASRGPDPSAWCHIIETIQWPRYKYRVGTLRDGNGTALGAVVRLKARLKRQRAFGARIGTLRTMRCRQYEIRDRKDRCVLCILGPRGRGDAAVIVLSPDHHEVLRIGPRSRVNWRRSSYALEVEGIVVGSLSADLTSIRDVNGVIISRIRLRRLNDVPHEFAIEPHLEHPLFSAGVVAAICQRSRTGDGGSGGG